MEPYHARDFALNIETINRCWYIGYIEIITQIDNWWIYNIKKY